MKCRILLVFVWLSTAGLGFAQGWEKYVAPDGSFSFVYPEGWTVSQNESIIQVSDEATDQELLVVGIPYDAAKTPRQLADGMIAIFRSGMPDLTPSEWRTTPETRDVAIRFRAKYTEEGKKFDANVIVVKDKDSKQVLWFSYSAPLAGYDSARANDVLQKVLGSVSTGSQVAERQPEQAKPAPGTGPRESGLDRNAKAFLFVVEFSLGAPLTASQEKVILAELLSGWRSTPADELRKFDQYPVIVQAIMKAGQSDLESLRGELESSVREWITAYRGKSESVRIIENELQRRGRVVAQGQPPLTEMAAAAYAEIMAFSELLQRDPTAGVDDIPEATVLEIRQQLRNAWAKLAQADRESIATSPGLWLCLRTLMTQGTSSERDKTRAQIRRLTASQASSTAGGQLSAQDREMSRTLTENFVKHNILMDMQRTTFNQYMWSRGFNYHPTYGKMW